MSISPTLAHPRGAGPARLLDALDRFGLYFFGAVLFALPLIYPLGIGRDYPNHLARIFIQYRLDQEPLLAGNYRLDWIVAPDLAMDIFALPLGSWLSPYLVGGLFNGLTLVLLFSAAVALGRRNSTANGIWPFLAMTVVFNETLNWGFMNFLFGCGLCLWLVYFWLESEHWPWLRRVAVFSAAQLVLFFAHLLGFLLCGYFILVLELVRLWQRREEAWPVRLRRLLVSQLQFVLPMLLFAYVLLSQEGVGDSTTVYGPLGARLVALFSPFSAHNLTFSPVLLVAVVGLIYIASRVHKATFDPQLQQLVVAAFVLAAAMPVEFMGVWGLHFRYPFIAFLLLIASVRLCPGHSGNRVLEFGAVAAAVVALGLGSIEFHNNDRRMQEIRQALRLSEPGSALLVAASYQPDCQGCLPELVDEVHAGALGVIERQMFVPTLFTATSLVEASPARHDLDVPSGLPKRRVELIAGRSRPLPQRGAAHDARHPYWYSWDRHYDYLLWLNANGAELDDLEGLERLASGEAFVLYRIVRQSDGAAAGDGMATGLQ